MVIGVEVGFQDTFWAHVAGCCKGIGVGHSDWGDPGSTPTGELFADVTVMRTARATAELWLEAQHIPESVELSVS